MTLQDRYRPRALSEIVGQPNIYKLMALAARPRRSCWMMEGSAGVGKSCTAHALADELGCSIFSKHPIKGSKLDTATAEKLFNETTRCVPMDGAAVTPEAKTIGGRCSRGESTATLGPAGSRRENEMKIQLAKTKFYELSCPDDERIGYDGYSLRQWEEILDERRSARPRDERVLAEAEAVVSALVRRNRHRYPAW